MSHENNVSRIKTVCHALGDIKDQVVFVGGSTLSFYADREAFEVRETDDVDVIVEVLTFAQHAKFEEEIRKRGFSPDVNSKVRVRYKVKDITVDFMPTTDTAIGFKNVWYPDGYRNSIDHSIGDDVTIKILAPEYFIATKMEAFKDRGSKDPRQSQDFEDIVFVLENRRAIWGELARADRKLREYLKEEFAKLLSDSGVYEWIDCHVDFDSPRSTDLIIEEMKRFVG
ncbi:MAG: nucleotidyl transferase AbiEii/AbiGii toxin family protein [Bacteroidota bacterium]